MGNELAAPLLLSMACLVVLGVLLGLRGRIDVWLSRRGQRDLRGD